MSHTDMRIPSNTLDGILPSEEVAQPVSLSLVIPYLDVCFEGVPEEHITRLLEAAFSIFLSRYTTKPLKENLGEPVVRSLFDGIMATNTDTFINITDDYELMVTECTVGGIIDYELECNQELDPDGYRMTREPYYEGIIGNTVKTLDDTLGSMIYGNNETQLEVLLSCFELVGETLIHKYVYDQDNHRLWLSVSG